MERLLNLILGNSSGRAQQFASEGEVAASSSLANVVRSRWAAAVILLLITFQGTVCFLGAERSVSGKVDLRAFYAAGTIVRTGHAAQLYDYEYQRKVQNVVVGQRAGALPFLYPPFAALLFVPFSFLPYTTAFFAFLFGNLCLLCVAAGLMFPLVPALHPRSWVFLAGAYSCVFPVSVALMQGQISFVLLVVYCGAYVLLQKEKGFAAGLLLSMGLMKFQLVLPIIVLFAVWRHWSLVSGFISGGVGTLGTSAAMIGRAGVASYFRSLLGIANKVAHDPVAAKARYGMFPTDMPNLHGLSYALAHGAPWGNVVNFLLCFSVLGFVARQRASLPVALSAAMLVSYHMQPHDLTLLLLPLTVAGNDLFVMGTHAFGGTEQVWTSSKSAYVGALLLLIAPLAAVVMSKQVGYLWSVAIALLMVANSADDAGGKAVGRSPGSEVIQEVGSDSLLLLRD